jgi:hypothetical protein
MRPDALFGSMLFVFFLSKKVVTHSAQVQMFGGKTYKEHAMNTYNEIVQ